MLTQKEIEEFKKIQDYLDDLKGMAMEIIPADEGSYLYRLGVQKSIDFLEGKINE